MSESSIYLSSGGAITPEGDALSGFTVPAGATLVVLSGGVATGSVVDAGAGLVLSGGTAAGSLISSGAVESVTAGGTETSAAVFSGGLLAVASGGTALAAGLLSGGSISAGTGAALTYTTDLPGPGRAEFAADGSGYGVSLASGTVQTYTVASAGWVTITAEGAAGGANYVQLGGAGAAVTASFDLNAGTVLEIIVGGSGEGVGQNDPVAGNDGGGGGSFVYDKTAGMFLHQPTSTISPIYLTLNRAYDPYSGRWLSRDPAGEKPQIIDHDLALTGAFGILDQTENTDLYSYVGDNPIINTDPFGLWTAQFGISFGATLPGGFSGTLFGGVAFDSNGNFGFYHGGGFGAGLGSGVGGGASAQFSNAQNICDLSGPFNNISRGGGWGPDITGDGFEGPSSDGPVVGGGVTVGDGIGSTSFSGATNTWVNLLW